MPHLLQQGKRGTLKEMEKELARIAHEQWVDFHWQDPKAPIHNDIRMPQTLSAFAIRFVT